MAQPEIGRVVLMPNPAALGSGLAEHVKGQITSSRRWRRDAIILPTQPGGLEPNAEMLRKSLEPGDAIGALCGDGSFWFIVGGLIVSKLANSVPVASLGGGNARDIGRATQRRRGTPAAEFLAQAHAVQSYALRSEITHGQRTSTFFAASYMGWGKTALGAARVNTAEYRNGWRPYQDLRVGTTTLNNPHAFTITDQQGASHRLGDLTVATSSQIAKVGRPPVKPWEKQMWVAPTKPGRLRAWAALGGLLVGSSLPMFGAYHDGPYRFTLESSAPYHFDGETLWPGKYQQIILEPGTEVTVGLDERPYQLLTDVRGAFQRDF